MIDLVPFDDIVPEVPKDDRVPLTQQQWKIRALRQRCGLKPLRRCHADWEQEVAIPALKARGFEVDANGAWWSQDHPESDALFIRHCRIRSSEGRDVRVFYELPKT